METILVSIAILILFGIVIFLFLQTEGYVKGIAKQIRELGDACDQLHMSQTKLHTRITKWEMREQETKGVKESFPTDGVINHDSK